MFEKSSNPIFSRTKFNASAYTTDQSQVMTMNGTINKTFTMLLMVIVSASLTWKAALPYTQTATGISLYNPGLVSMLMISGLIGGLIAALITVFKKEWAGVTAPIYAICEGLFLGGLSAWVEAMFPGLVIKAVMLTFGVFFLMLMAYRMQIIKPTQKLMMGIMIATGAIALFYFVQMILNMFGVMLPTQGNGMIGIGFSVVVVAIAALNLILDFKMVEDGVAQGAPKFMEWYASFGLLVTLVWLYIEILNLLMKLQSRN